GDLLPGPWMNVADDLLVHFAVEDELKVQLILKDLEPGIGAGTADQDQVIVRLQVRDAQAARRASPNPRGRRSQPSDADSQGCVHRCRIVRMSIKEVERPLRRRKR